MYWLHGKVADSRFQALQVKAKIPEPKSREDVKKLRNMGKRHKDQLEQEPPGN